MLVKCLLGTVPRTVNFPDCSYTFAPNDDGVLVCDVTDKAHLAWFLARPHAHELYDDVPPAPQVADAPKRRGRPPKSAGIVGMEPPPTAVEDPNEPLAPVV